MLYIYCPDCHCQLVRSAVANLRVEFVLNDYSGECTSIDSVCHYDLDHMSMDQQNYLVKLLERGIAVQPLVGYLDKLYGFTEISLLKPRYFLHQRAFSTLTDKSKEIRKRILDWVLIFFVGVIALPVGVVAALIIKLDSRGPVFFRQLRVGRFNKEFEVIKFRSMRIDAEKDGAKWASKNDDRVTRVGRFIRKTRIDELPQIINVIRGEMSFVGPRPEREVFIKDLEKVIPYYRFRHAVRPGITGLAQVKYPYGASVEDAEWKHRYDMYYIKHRRFWLDVKIILLTVKVVLFGMGR